MSGISEIQTRIQAIHQRVAQPAVPRGFGAVLAAQVTASGSSGGTSEGTANPDSAEDYFVVTPQAQKATAGG